MLSNLTSVLTKQQRIAELAQRLPELAFTSLAYHIDLHWLEEAYHRTRKDGAAGVDDITGTPQGGVISPLLANIYLHYVLDEWFEKQVKPVMRGKCVVITPTMVFWETSVHLEVSTSKYAVVGYDGSIAEITDVALLGRSF